jgi:heme-degrading monooxygenase HmoA
MTAVIFEVEPAPERRDDYLSTAAALKPLLERIDGFISVERFQSLTNPDKILSLSFFRDEEAVKAWRNTTQHRNAQAAGRSGIFKGYRLQHSRTRNPWRLRNRLGQARRLAQRPDAKNTDDIPARDVCPYPNPSELAMRKLNLVRFLGLGTA